MENEENKIIFKAEFRKDGRLCIRCNNVEITELMNVMSEIICEIVKTEDCKSDKIAEANDILKGIKMLVSMKLEAEDFEEE